MALRDEGAAKALASMPLNGSFNLLFELHNLKRPSLRHKNEFLCTYMSTTLFFDLFPYAGHIQEALLLNVLAIFFYRLFM